MKNFLSAVLITMAGLSAVSDLVAQTPAVSQPVAIPGAGLPTPPAVPAPTLETMIQWNSERKEVTVPSGTPEAKFTFNLTNISTEVVTIDTVHTSCGCTVAQLPQNPWKIAPGEGGQINATMNLAGKTGTSVKTLTVNSDKGQKTLFVQSTVLPPAGPAATMSPMDREAAQKLAIADRQAVFKGDCASCHAVPTKGKFSAQLYTAACGVCHEAEHRASMVPNLHAIAQETNAEFWRNWIAHGKPGTLMPAFAISEGGILSDEQVTSLVNYLVATIPSKAVAPAK